MKGFKRGLYVLDVLKNAPSQSLSEGEEPSIKEEEGEKKKKSFKWICPSCGIIVRSTKKDLFIKCGDCNQRLIEEE